jgi:hypothetical protein
VFEDNQHIGRVILHELAAISAGRHRWVGRVPSFDGHNAQEIALAAADSGAKRDRLCTWAIPAGINIDANVYLARGSKDSRSDRVASFTVVLLDHGGSGANQFLIGLVESQVLHGLSVYERAD